MKFLKLHALQRTGSNYFESLLLKNFNNLEILTHLLGWKHSYPKEIDWSGNDWCSPFIIDEQEKHHIISKRLGHAKEINLKENFDNKKIDYIFLIKHPYAWLESVINKNSIAYKNMDDEQIIGHWNFVNKKYLQFARNNNFLCIKYEDFFEDGYEKVLDKISIHYGLSKKNNIENIMFEVGPNLTNVRQTMEVYNHNTKMVDVYCLPELVDFSADPRMKYYKEKKYLNFKNRDRLKYSVDKDLARELRYEL